MNRALHLTALAAAAGGAAWLVKFAVIAATDGAETLTAVTAVLYVLGVALMAVGAATVTLRATRGRLPVLAAIAAPFLFFLSFLVLEAPAKALVGDAGPSWLDDEAGIALTGAFWLAIGLWCLRDSADAARRARTRPVSLDGAAS